MNLLFVKALIRTIAFITWTCFSAWLFVQVEHTENDFVDQKYQLLRSLYISMVSKYNMTNHRRLQQLFQYCTRGIVRT